MSNNTTGLNKYPILSEMLSVKQLPLRAAYSIRDVAQLFGVSPRAIQNRIASGQLVARDLPGRVKFLADDLETFLASSKRKVARRDN